MRKILKFDDINILAKKLGLYVKSGDVLVLIGDLGTGKTTFTKEFAKSLGITDNIKSPTFNYVLEYYGGRFPLYHFDMYRISDPMEVYEIGYEDYIRGDGISVIEWGDLIKSELPEEYIELLFEYTDDLDNEKRYVTLSYVGEKKVGEDKKEEEMLRYVGFSD
ncbi:MAG: tRNA (adenosine(37)-N6)-threonylcarbamoyltransferase complex ATPase subunit type 1 TsaE [Fusobacteriaceae bacterium]|jgi:tRNA threonylcarbamoyladenosine biosynthesis protein TsaE|nr:tRNA (adenosine(37)-N6)-threonylcarbamoyltransferase complex ATPase subunit type 1 TsaE [Fusobacteriaceae bacterium]